MAGLTKPIYGKYITRILIFVSLML